MDDGLCVLAEPGRGRQLAAVVGDGGGVPGGGRVAQRERLQQQPDHALVPHVELVLAADDLLAVLVAAQERAQQQLADAEGEHEEGDDAGAVELEAVDGHRGDRARGQLPGDDRQEDALEHLPQRPAAREHDVPGDHREVEDVGQTEDHEHREREPALLRARGRLESVEDQRAEQREERIDRGVAEHRHPACARVQRVGHRAAEADQDGGSGAEQRHREHEAQERARDAGALGLECQEIAPPGEDGEQADERRLLPLLGRGEQRGGPEAAGEDGRLGGEQRPAPAGRGRQARLRLPQHARLGARPQPVLTRARGAHERERPGDDHEPEDDGQPDDHTEKVVRCWPVRQLGT